MLDLLEIPETRLEPDDECIALCFALFASRGARTTLLSRQRGEARKWLKCRESERHGSSEKLVMIETAAAQKSSITAHEGEPSEIDVSILYFTDDPNSTLELAVS
jgi:hypothetical protein